jgi:hypothetical protein
MAYCGEMQPFEEGEIILVLRASQVKDALLEAFPRDRDFLNSEDFLNFVQIHFDSDESVQNFCRVFSNFTICAKKFTGAKKETLGAWTTLFAPGSD